MSLDGLRAWIGEVERKLGMRTRVFLVLAVIAVGGAGAAIYLAVDARDSAVSESDVQELQEQLEAQIGGGGGATAGADTTQLEAELKALQAQVEQLKGAGGGSQSGAGGGAGEGSAEKDSSPESPSGGASSDGGNPGTVPNGGSKARLEELLQQAQEESEEAEGK